jgi:hypothetical protein
LWQLSSTCFPIPYGHISELGLLTDESTLRTLDYYIVTEQGETPPHRWSFEIQRLSKPMGVRLRGTGYQSKLAAEFAGRRALEDFLTQLTQEERRK